jgi:hypothetical protein
MRNPFGHLFAGTGIDLDDFMNRSVSMMTWVFASCYPDRAVPSGSTPGPECVCACMDHHASPSSL